MSKLQEKIDLYTESAQKLGIELNADLFKLVTKGLGPSIYKEDAELVSSSNKEELETVKKNFLIKKLGLEKNEEVFDAAIAKVIETLGSGNKKKYRALFYYLLVKETGSEAVYDVAKEEAVVEAPVKEKKKEEKIAEPKKEEVIEEKVAEKAVAQVEETVEAVADKAEEKVDAGKFLSEFDWQKYEEGIEAVDQSQLDEFDSALENTVGFVEERQVIDGTVIRLTDREAIIDINSKSEGVISLNEFRYNPNLKVGDTVEVKVDKLEDNTGQLVLSHRKARVIRA